MSSPPPTAPSAGPYEPDRPRSASLDSVSQEAGRLLDSDENYDSRTRVWVPSCSGASGHSPTLNLATETVMIGFSQ